MPNGILNFNGKKIVTCNLCTEKNGWKCECSRINSDDWDELEDPCSGCSHRTWMEILPQKTIDVPKQPRILQLTGNLVFPTMPRKKYLPKPENISKKLKD